MKNNPGKRYSATRVGGSRSCSLWETRIQKNNNRSPWLKIDAICAQPPLGKEAYVLIAETLHYWNYSNQWMNKMAKYNWIWWKRWWIPNQFRLLHIIDCAIKWLLSNLNPRRRYVDPKHEILTRLNHDISIPINSIRKLGLSAAVKSPTPEHFLYHRPKISNSLA